MCAQLSGIRDHSEYLLNSLLNQVGSSTITAEGVWLLGLPYDPKSNRDSVYQYSVIADNEGNDHVPFEIGIFCAALIFQKKKNLAEAHLALAKAELARTRHALKHLNQDSAQR